MAEHNDVGQIGEDITATWYEGKGYRVIARNYRKPYGEIDLICQSGKERVFVEVKTLSVKDERYLSHSSSDFKPEEAVHPWKQKKFARIIEAYLLASNWEGEWRIDIASVRVHLPSKQARIKVISDVVLG